MVQLAGLVVEYLIIGLVSSIWIALFVLSLGEFNLKLDPSILIFTPLLYVLGMVSDFLGSSVLSKSKEEIEINILSKSGINPETFSNHRLNVQLTVHCPELSKALEMRVSRYRIARGTLVNIPFVGLSAIWLYYVSALSPSPIFVVILLILTVLFCVVIFKMWAKFLRDFVKHQVASVQVLKELLKKKRIKYLD